MKFKIDNKKKKLSKQLINMYPKYKSGDSISVTTRDYAKMFNAYLRAIGNNNEGKIYSTVKVNSQIKQGKRFRPLLVIWNDKFSRKMIVAPMTTSENKYVTYELKDGSYASLNVLVLDKNQIEVLFNGSIHETHDEAKMKEFIESIKAKRYKTYQYYLELRTELMEKAAQEKEKQFNELLLKMQNK